MKTYWSNIFFRLNLLDWLVVILLFSSLSLYFLLGDKVAKQHSLEREVRRLQQEVGEMERVVHRLPGDGESGRMGQEHSTLLSRIDGMIRHAELTSQVKRLEQEGDGQVEQAKLVMEKVAFDRWIVMLGAMADKGIELRSCTIEGERNDGEVTLRVKLAMM